MGGPGRVGLNLLYLVPGETGGAETYARRLVPALAKGEPDVEFVAFLNREAFSDPDLESLRGSVTPVRVNVSGRSRAARVLAEQIVLPRLVRRHRVDLLHSLASTGPRFPRVISVVTVLDVIYATRPEAHTRLMRAGMRILVPLGARGADRLITISNAAAAEIAEVLRVPREHVDVVYLGGLPPGEATPAAELRARLELGDAPVVLSVSAHRPHKNLARLLRAFAAVEARPPPTLVLPGYPTTFEDALYDEARRLRIDRRVRFLGWISDPDLEGLYRAASCFVFPSLAEGFGLPVLEAMERGLPVACSRASSLPEVAGDAVRYFDPFDLEEIRAAIEELLSDRHLAGELASAGKRRAAQFSWERAAHETLGVYERAIASVARGGSQLST